MNESPPVFSGILGTLRRLADDGLGAVKDRLELIAIEIEEEKTRLIRLCIWISAAVVAGLLALILFSFTIIYLCSPGVRPYALVGLTLIYAAVAIFIVRGVRHSVATAPRMFATTTAELTEDRSCLDSDNPTS
jgi:uncharacterized membrane protein YqjE